MSARRARPLLGTLFEVRIDQYPDNCDIAAAFEAAFAAAQKVQVLMSAQDPESEVSRINRAAPLERVTVHAWTYRVLVRACEIARASNGLFDPCVGPLLQEAGYLPRMSKSTDRERGSHRDLELCNCTVWKHRPLQITLDGIAKGFAVDQATAALQTAGVEAGIVNAGGDLRVFGRREQLIHVRDPGNPGRVAFVGTLCESALATSAAYFSRRVQDGRPTSHIFHPETGEPFLDSSSASVVAGDCMTADALAKAVLLDEDAAAVALARYGARAVLLHTEQEAA